MPAYRYPPVPLWLKALTVGAGIYVTFGIIYMWYLTPKPYWLSMPIDLIVTIVVGMAAHNIIKIWRNSGPR